MSILGCIRNKVASRSEEIIGKTTSGPLFPETCLLLLPKGKVILTKNIIISMKEIMGTVKQLKGGLSIQFELCHVAFIR